MERDTIIFSGASHVFGLGLEWELDEELNSEEYLQKGIHIPIPRLPHYQKYWREYRWPTLLCNQLGYRQYNIHDLENEIKIGGNAVETLWQMVKNEKLIQELLSRTKYVILQIGHIRWYDEKLHGGPEGHKYPNTILEMIDLINNPIANQEIVSKTLDWIRQIDPDAYMIELYNKIEYLKTNYPEIIFLILPWHTNYDGINIKTSHSLKENIIDIVEIDASYPDVNSFLLINKLFVSHKAKGWNGNYKFNYREDHASIEGHQRVANIVMNHIQKLENNKLIKTTI